MKQYHEINFVRAVLICMVILVHIVNFGTHYPALKEAILAFMMPSFLVITGYLVNVRKSAKEFSFYLLRIFVPYLIMVVSFSLVSLYLPVNGGLKEATLSALFEKVFLTSIGPYWFLYTMMGCGICYYLSFRFLPVQWHLAIKLLAFAGLLCVASLFLPVMTIKSVMYYFLGSVLRQFDVDFNKAFRPKFYFFFIFLFIICQPEIRGWSHPLIILAVFSFISFSGWVCGQLPPKVLRFADWLGMNTLPIYLFHPIFTMAGKFYLRFFAWEETGWLHVFVTLLLSISGSLAIAYLLDKTHVSRIFGRAKFFRSAAVNKNGTN